MRRESGYAMPEYVTLRQCKDIARWFPDTEDEYDDLVEMASRHGRPGSFMLYYQYEIDTGISRVTIEPEQEAHLSRNTSVKSRVIVGYINIEFFAFNFYTYDGMASRTNYIAHQLMARVNRDIHGQVIRAGWAHLV